MHPFHLAIPVKDLESTRAFYGGVLRLKEGRSTDKWIDWNFHGHQVSTHVAVDEIGLPQANAVDGHNVPCRHFGLVMEWEEWHRYRDFLLEKKLNFIIKPYIRFKGEIGEQATMFFLDPSDNAIEIKSFKEMEMLFKPYDS